MSDSKKVICSPDQFIEMQNEIMNLKFELASKETEIQQVRTANRQFVEIVSHDLRNPLSVILSFTDFLSDETKDILNAVQKDFLTRIENSAKFMLALISDLHDITRLDARELEVSSEILDIVALVSENVNTNQAMAVEKNIRLLFKSDKAVVNVMGDKTRLNQVFNNLLSNAVKFSDSGATVKVQITMEDEKVLIGVADKGMGIAAENLEMIFSPFKKITRKGTNNEKGTGLGLAISRLIVEAHQGKIHVESEVGKGSSFFVSLPLESDDQGVRSKE